MKTLLAILSVLITFQARSASPYEHRIVASVLRAEAMGEGEKGMIAVAEVIRNRANESGKTPLQVVVKRNEFSSLNKTTPDRLYKKYSKAKPFPVALRIAQTCYTNKLPGITKGATFYDNKRNHPYWLSEVRLVAVVGNHNFYVPR